MTARAPSTTSKPTIGWLIGHSLWMLPVLFGFGTTTWLGFAIVGFAAGRFAWIAAAAIAFGALIVFEIDVDEAMYRIGRFLDGSVSLDDDLPLLVLYLAGVAFAIHVNRAWLRARWERTTGGGKRTRTTGTYHRAARSVPPEPTRAELEARAARAFRAHELEQLRQASPVASPPAETIVSDAATPTPVPSSRPDAPPLAFTPTTVTSSLGLPRGPIDVRTATLDEIAAIPAMGHARAALVVATRGVRTLDSADEVIELLDLPAADAIRMRPYLRF